MADDTLSLLRLPESRHKRTRSLYGIVYNSVERYILFVKKTLKYTYSRFYMCRTGKIQNVGMSDVNVKWQK